MKSCTRQRKNAMLNAISTLILLCVQLQSPVLQDKSVMTETSGFPCDLLMT